MRTALTIAGSDSSGGAGIQADIKTMISNGVYAMSAITALTAQNTTGVTGIMEVTPEFLGEQLDNIFTDIYPDAVKIGMVSSSGLITKIADKLKEYDLDESVERAKKYISGALAAMLDLGKGSGPMNHGFAIKNEYTESKVEE